MSESKVNPPPCETCIVYAACRSRIQTCYMGTRDLTTQAIIDLRKECSPIDKYLGGGSHTFTYRCREMIQVKYVMGVTDLVPYYETACIF